MSVIPTLQATLAVVVVGLCFSAAPARAHPLVDEGIERYESADFDAALRSFAQAEAAGDLTRSDLTDLLEARALVHLARGAQEPMEHELLRLCSVEADHRFRPEAPPELRQTFRAVCRRLPGPLRLSPRTERVAGGVRVQVSVQRDPGGLVRDVRVFGRAPGGEWQRSGGGSLHVPVPMDSRIEYYVVALGPGGAPVASLGSESSPRRASPVAMMLRRPPGESGSSPWVWVGIGVVVVGAATVAALLLVERPLTDDTRPQVPTVVGW